MTWRVLLFLLAGLFVIAAAAAFVIEWPVLFG